MAAQLENVTRAADRLGTSPSTVSVQIKSLERDLGVALFIRKGPKLELTDPGKRMLELSLAHVEAIENLPQLFNARENEQKRTELHLAGNSTTIQFLYPQLLKKFLQTRPDMHITIHFGETDRAIKKLESEEVEAAYLPLRAHVPFPKHLKFLPLSTYEACLITPKDHPLAGRRKLTVEEISKFELSLPPEELRVIPTLYEIFPRAKVSKRLRIHFRDWETTRRYIEEGLVISISSSVIIADEDMLTATSLSHLFPDSTYGLLVRKGKLSTSVQQLLDTALRVRRRGG